MPRLSFYPIDGKTPDAIRATVHNFVSSHIGKKLWLTIEEALAYTSGNQRKYYFACIVEPVMEMFNEAGNNITKDQMHEWLKRHVGNLLVSIDGKEVTESYTRLSKKRAEQYHEQVRAWAAEQGLQIELPHEALENA